MKCLMSTVEEEAKQSLNIGKGSKLFLICLDATSFKRKKSSFKKWTSCLVALGAAEVGIGEDDGALPIMSLPVGC